MVFVLLTVGSLFFYLVTLSSSVYGADSGDLIAAAFVGGIPHPPGYPLYTMLARVFISLPFAASVAWKVGLLSAIFQALTVGFFYLAAEKLLKNKLVAFSSSLFLAFLFPFWLFSAVAEVFPLNNFFAVLLIYLALNLREKKDKVARGPLFLLFALSLGLSISHHLTIILIFPALFVLLWPYIRKIVEIKYFLYFLIFFILGLLPYLYLPIAAFHNPPINWGNATTLSGFLTLITRADYGTFQVSRNLFGSGVDRANLLFWFFGFMVSDFTWVGIFLILVGTYFLAKFRKGLLLFFLLGFLVSGPFFLFYSGFPPSGSFLLGVVERFLFLPYIFLVFIFGFGILAVAEAFSLLSSRFGLLSQRKELLKFAVILSSLTLALYLGLANFNKVNLRNFTLGDDLGYDVLATAEPNSIVILQDDTVTFNTQYVYYALNIRPDIILIMPGQMRKLYYRESLRRKYSNLLFPEPKQTQGDFGYQNAFFTKALVEANIDRLPIYSYSVGPTIEGWEWVPVGIMIKLYKSDQLPTATDYGELQRRTWSKYKFKIENANKVYHQLIVDHIVGVYKYAYYNVGLHFLKLGQSEKAFYNFSQALEIDPYFVQVRLKLAKVKEEKGDCYGAEDDLETIVEKEKMNVEVLEALGNLYKNCLKNEAKATIYRERLAKIKKDSSKTDSLEKF